MGNDMADERPTEAIAPTLVAQAPQDAAQQRAILTLQRALSEDVASLPVAIGIARQFVSTEEASKASVQLGILFVRSLIARLQLDQVEPATEEMDEIDRISLKSVEAAFEVRDTALLIEALQTRAHVMAEIQQTHSAIESETALLATKTLLDSHLGPDFCFAGVSLAFTVGPLHRISENKSSHERVLKRYIAIQTVTSAFRAAVGDQRLAGLSMLRAKLAEQQKSDDPSNLPYVLMMTLNALLIIGDSPNTRETFRSINDALVAWQKKRSPSLGTSSGRSRRRGPLTDEQRDEVERSYAFFHTEAVFCELTQDRTGLHPFRVGRLARLLAARRGMDTDTCFFIEMAARLHDIGLLYLQSPGITEALMFRDTEVGLTIEERRLMQSHCRNGSIAISASGLENCWLAADVAENHHERWDGKGYPAGKAGFAISEASRITAICDAFDVMTHSRSYRDAISISQAQGALVQGKGSQFDPDLVDLFNELIDDLLGFSSELDAQLYATPDNLRRLIARQAPEPMLRLAEVTRRTSKPPSRMNRGAG